MQNGGWSNGGASPDLTMGVDHYFLNGNNVASILNGKLYIFDHNAVVGTGGQWGDAPYLHSLGYPEASQGEVSNLINEDAPGNGAGKGSMKEGIMSAIAAAGLMYGAGNLTDYLGQYLSGAEVPWGVNQRLTDEALLRAVQLDELAMPGVGNPYQVGTPAWQTFDATPWAIPPVSTPGGAEQPPAPVEDRTPKPVSQPSGFNLRDAAGIASLASAAAGFLSRGASTGNAASGALNLGPDGSIPGAADPTGAPLPPAVDPSVQAALDAAEAQRVAEEARAARIKDSTNRVNTMFGGFNDDYYGSIADAYRDFQMPLLDEQAKEARRVLPFGTASTQSSAYQRQAGNLERDVARQTADVANKGVSFANTRRGEVENSRSGLLNLAQSGADVETVNAAAADASKVFGTPSPYIQGAIVPTPVSQQQFSPISDLFAKYTADAANGALAQRQGYLPPKFSTPLTFGGSGGKGSAVRNVA